MFVTHNGVHAAPVAAANTAVFQLATVLCEYAPVTALPTVKQAAEQQGPRRHSQ